MLSVRVNRVCTPPDLEWQEFDQSNSDWQVMKQYTVYSEHQAVGIPGVIDGESVQTLMSCHDPDGCVGVRTGYCPSIDGRVMIVPLGHHKVCVRTGTVEIIIEDIVTGEGEPERKEE